MSVRRKAAYTAVAAAAVPPDVRQEPLGAHDVTGVGETAGVGVMVGVIVVVAVGSGVSVGGSGISSGVGGSCCSIAARS